MFSTLLKRWSWLLLVPILPLVLSATTPDAPSKLPPQPSSLVQSHFAGTLTPDESQPLLPAPTPAPAPASPPQPSPAPQNATPQAAPAPAPKSAPAPAPAPIGAPAPAAPAPAPQKPPYDGGVSIFKSYLIKVGASWVDVSLDYSVCPSPDKGPDYAQGCARSDHPSTLFMKAVDQSLAEDRASKGVVLHEYSHLLQFKLGYDSVVAAADPIFGSGRGFELSADCMAMALGAPPAPGGYTSDCSGDRGALANAFLAGRTSLS